MFNFAIIENDSKISNIIVAENKLDAEIATGKTVVQYNDEDIVYIGGTWDGEKFIPPIFPEPVIVETEAT
jgi:hypothetical protein